MPFRTIDVSKFKRPQRRSRRSVIILSALALLIVLSAVGLYVYGSRTTTSSDDPSTSRTSAQDANSPATSKQQPASSGRPEAAANLPVFNKKQYSLDDPASQWVIANKRRPLQPVDYVPPLATPNVPLRLAAGVPEMSVSSQIVPSLEAMFDAARQAGVELMLASGYRSYSTQVAVYNNEVATYGQAAADTQSARPGHSEHQTGLALDIEPVSRQCEIQDCFGDLPEGKWLAANAYKYGFVMRYMPNSEAVTGYRYEAWHYRYVGSELAAELQRLGNPPLETFFGTGPAPGY